jgi:hypothetical protein
MKYLKQIAMILMFGIPTLSMGTPRYGATLSIATLAKEPPHLLGYQLTFNYDPQRFQWRKFNIYFDGGYSHLWLTHSSPYSSIDIYSIAPVIQYTFKKRGPMVPYLTLSIGLSYLSQTQFEQRKLGIHYAFQDRIGLGVYVGEKKQFSLGFHAAHYSNACLSKHNSGITIPIMMDIGYWF